MSGLNQQFTKLSSQKWFREFESHILRMVNFTPANERFETLTTVLSWVGIVVVCVGSIYPFIILLLCTDACVAGVHHFIIPTVFLFGSIFAIVKERYISTIMLLAMTLLLFGLLVRFYVR